MNYPSWELMATGGGFWIALVAITHVFVSHFAVGGGLWLVLTEQRALRKRDDQLLAYVKGHAHFFLLLTMVFGGLSGVGIWWTIALLSPGATSELIHTFVFGWAAEWVCFAAEIVALFIYHYTFGRMRAREHVIIGWYYFVFAWLSLFLINGIIGFMLTPGGWLQGGGFWAGFFNPSFLPSLVMRTMLALMIAGMFGLLTAVHQRDEAFRARVVRWSATWLLAGVVPMALAAWWYVQALPDPQRGMVLGRAREVAPYLAWFLRLSPVLLVLALLMMARLPRLASRPLAWVVMAVGFAHLGSFEFVREGGRRPWVIHGAIYSTGLRPADVARADADGFLATARWTGAKAVTADDPVGAGREIFRFQCAPCHSIGGPLNDVLPLTAGLPETGLESQLAGQGSVVPYMPPFAGTRAERAAVAAYLARGLHGRQPDEPPTLSPPPDAAVGIPPFSAANDAWVLLAWGSMGMHCLTDSDPWFVILPPSNELHAQLIRRGPTPEVVTDGVVLSYAVEPGFEQPERDVRFWEFARANFGADLEPGTGLAGHRVSGQMAMDEAGGLFTAAAVPVVPYRNGRYHPYPLFTIEARDAATGEVLARTRMVAPTSTEMGCGRCHGGGWRIDGVAGFTEATSRAILAVHDKHSGTDLLRGADRGEPRLCGSCHADPAVGRAGEPGQLNLSAAIHGWHANYLRGRGADACALCHPADLDGPTGCLRDGHAGSLDCTDCHGALEDHALALLKAEHDAGKPGAQRLMDHLSPRAVASLADIVGRTPWLQQPDCLGCHADFEAPAELAAFNHWTAGKEGLFRERRDESGTVACLACHGPTHATYPAQDRIWGSDRDNIQPLQYQGNRRPIGGGGNCAVCHQQDMEDSVHHANMPGGAS
ncbi:MAG: cytochrome C [bacterium]|nr:cytochrome C [bacterium]